jgi:hypothetical protein
MFRWLLVIFFVLMLVNAFTSWFKRIGFGRLPGDLNFTLFGREFNLPFTTTIVLSLVAGGHCAFSLGAPAASCRLEIHTPYPYLERRKGLP